MSVFDELHALGHLGSECLNLIEQLAREESRRFPVLEPGDGWQQVDLEDLLIAFLTDRIRPVTAMLAKRGPRSGSRVMRGRFEARLQAEAMLATLGRDHSGVLAALREDPLGELERWSAVSLSLVPQADADGNRCSVAGSYPIPSPEFPPALLVSRSRSIRRRGFTALHELGHHLQQTDPGLGQRLFTVQDSEALEEEACDAFAARVLLPDDEVASHIDPRSPTAASVVELFQRFQASREACCVRAAEHLTGAGVVVLLDAVGTVFFAAPRSFIPPARGSDQSNTRRRHQGGDRPKTPCRSQPARHNVDHGEQMRSQRTAAQLLRSSFPIQPNPAVRPPAARRLAPRDEPSSASSRSRSC